jgi:hypothetical protein
MGAHWTQESATPAAPCWRKVPPSHDAQRESDAVVQTSSEVQLDTSEQGEQTEWPSTVCRYLPALHCVHCESVALVQVRLDSQNGTAVHWMHESATGPPSWR